MARQTDRIRTMRRLAREYRRLAKIVGEDVLRDEYMRRAVFWGQRAAQEECLKEVGVWGYELIEVDFSENAVLH